MDSQKRASASKNPAQGSNIPSKNPKSKTSDTMTFHIDPDLKREVSEIVEDFGLSLTAVTRAFYKQIVRDGAIPLSFRYDAGRVKEPEALIGASSREE